MGSPGSPAPPPPPGPPPPPPGPPPAPALPPPPAAGGRLRALHWEPVPPERVRGRRSVWTPPAAPPPALDLPRLRMLFLEPRGAAPPGQRPPPAAALLEPKRSIALGVFLKQLKRPVPQIVRDIQEGVGAPYGAEKLRELSRLLPGPAEVSRLRSFPGPPAQLPEPERFMLLLTEVPSYAQRLELLVLQEELFPRLSTLRASIQTLTDAAVELLQCEELHTILHLILSAGNHLNSGGYAGSAAGFRVASLLKLPDTKATEPGLDLLHFVAMEAARADRNLLDFPNKLQHVGPASRIDAAEVERELGRLAGRLAGARGLGGLCPRLRPFLRAAEAELCGARDALRGMHRAAAAALDFYCEDPAPGALRDLCAALHGFSGRLLAAAQENRLREETRRRRQRLEHERLKRRSISTCSVRDPPHGPRTPLTPQPPRRALGPPRPGSEPCLAAPRAGGDPPGSPGCGGSPPGSPAPPAAPPAALLRRHTAPELPELGGSERPPCPGTPAGGQGGLPEPPLGVAPPGPSPFFSLAGLFQRRGSQKGLGTPSAPPDPTRGSQKGLGTPSAPPDAPPERSAWLDFFRRLAGGKGRGTPPS